MRWFAVCGLLAFAGCKNPTSESSAASPPHADFIKIEPGSPRLDFVKIEAVKESDNAGSLTLSGKIGFDEDHTQRLGSPIDGRVLAVPVKLGDRVHVGQPLVELSSPQVGQIQADAQKAIEDLNVQDKAMERMRKLKADGAVSEKEAAQVEADWRKSKADVARTSAQLRALGISASDPAVAVSLRAHVAGVVVERNVLVGQEVRADQPQPLLTVSSVDMVWVQADAYEQDLGAVEEGATVSLEVQAYPGEHFSGVVSHIGDVVDAHSRTVKIRCTVPNKAHRLKPEMFARVELAGKKGRNSIRIPVQSVLNEGQSTIVVVVGDGNVFRSRKIEVGPESEGQVRVFSGLQPGERIVTDGAIFLKSEIDGH